MSPHFRLSQSQCLQGTIDKPYSIEGITIILIVVLSLLIITQIIQCFQKCYVIRSLRKSKFANTLANKMFGHTDSNENEENPPTQPSQQNNDGISARTFQRKNHSG